MELRWVKMPTHMIRLETALAINEGNPEAQLMYIEAYAAQRVLESKKKEYGPEPHDDPRQLWLPFPIDNGGKDSERSDQEEESSGQSNS